MIQDYWFEHRSFIEKLHRLGHKTHEKDALIWAIKFERCVNLGVIYGIVRRFGQKPNKSVLIWAIIAFIDSGVIRSSRIGSNSGLFFIKI